MISDLIVQCEDETLTAEDESIEGISYLKNQILKLSSENERYKQDLHELHRKLEISQNMETELTEYHKTLEQSLEMQKAQNNQKIHEMEEKQMKLEKELQDKLAESEAELMKKIEENKALRETIRINDEKLSVSNQTQCSTTFVDNSDLLKSQIEELSELLTQADGIRKQHEETIQFMERESTILKEILASTKKQLVEKNEASESMREELFECRMELETLKAAPATNKSKGNSLFAEVEDRRKMTLGQMNSMRSSYLEAKRSYKAKEAEIKSLKAEISLLLRKWEDDTVEKIQQDASLVEKYRARIGELESRLKDEQKKNKQNTKGHQSQENNFTFLQSLIDAKCKKIEELSTKLENDSIKALLDEEHKHKMGKQLRYWRYRAMSSEAELVSIKDRLESDPECSNAEILEAIKKHSNNKNDESYATFMNESTLGNPTVVNETIVTLETLMEIPKKTTSLKDLKSDLSSVNKILDETLFMSETIQADASFITSKSISETKDSCPSNLSKVNETVESLTLSNNDSTLSMEETEICNNLQPFGSIQKEAGSDCQRMDDSMELTETIEQSADTYTAQNYEKSFDSDVTIVEPVLKSILSTVSVNANSTVLDKENHGKERKALRFAPETVDPPNKTLKKQTSAPKYPIVFISSNKSKK
ncbi:protein Spindly [Venturia canescens]|uniref:protein Spindly n=1 Tax=Venturia canescens TaxID=32260 RepID=UPI001C9C1788|nr:protein Spindly [Venturia canescens]